MFLEPATLKDSGSQPLLVELVYAVLGFAEPVFQELPAVMGPELKLATQVVLGGR